MTIELFKHIAGPLHGNVLLMVQVRHLGLRFRAVLHRLIHFFRKLGARLFPTTRAMLDLRLMFRHFHSHFRQVKHLALFNPLYFLPLQGFLAISALGNFVLFDMVGLFDPL